MEFRSLNFPKPLHCFPLYFPPFPLPGLQPVASPLHISHAPRRWECGKSKEVKVNLEQMCWSCGTAEDGGKKLIQGCSSRPPGSGLPGSRKWLQLSLIVCCFWGVLLTCFLFQSPLSCSGMGEGLKAVFNQRWGFQGGVLWAWPFGALNHAGNSRERCSVSE